MYQINEILHQYFFVESRGFFIVLYTVALFMLLFPADILISESTLGRKLQLPIDVFYVDFSWIWYS